MTRHPTGARPQWIGGSRSGKVGALYVRLVLLVLLSMGILTGAASCAEKQKDTEEYLEFNSGGENHPSGFGAWHVRLCGDGSLVVTHLVGGETKSRDVFMLTRDEARELFGFFCAVDIKRMKSSARPGVPDEVRYSFVLKDGSGTYSRSVWINDARRDPAIVDLVAYIETLIEKYAGIKPVMK